MPTPTHATAQDTAAPTRWFDVQGAADYASVSTWTIRQAVKTGDLAASAIGKGKQYRIKSSSIDAWLESKPYVP